MWKGSLLGRELQIGTGSFLEAFGGAKNEFQERKVRLQEAVAKVGCHAKNRHQHHDEHPNEPRFDLNRLLPDACHAVGHHHQPDNPQRPAQNRVVVHGMNGDKTNKNLLHESGGASESGGMDAVP